MGIFRQAREIIQLSRDSLYVVAVYGVGIALLSLSIPIAAQALVNAVSFTTLLQPVIVLTIAVFLILSLVAGMRIAQAVVVESLQQKVFVDVGLRLARTLPRISLSNFEKYRVSDLVNRFFEVQTVQKTLAVLLLTGIEVMLLAFFSMILIAFYHPLLLLFDVVIILLFLMILVLPWRSALHHAMEECEAKHNFAAWLEEIVHNILLFKVQNHSEYSLQVADSRLVNYLYSRQSHFSYLFRHIVGMNVLFAVANASALGIGGYLVINQELSLGQLVASELIISALLYGFIRVSYYLQDLYDFLTSCHKLDNLLSIACEQTEKLSKQHLVDLEAKLKFPPAISIENLNYTTANYKTLVGGKSFHIPAASHFVLQGAKGSGKSLLIDLLLGLRSFRHGVIRINDIPIQDYELQSLRNHIALVRKIELFSGTLHDNLVMHRTDIPIEDIHRAINRVKLDALVESLPEGLETFISGSQMTMSTTEMMKVMFVRAILTKPSLLIIDGVLDGMPDGDVKLMIDILKTYPATVIVTTRRKDVRKDFDAGIIL